MKYKYWYFIFSLLFILPGIYFLFRYGFNLSIDFTGGSLVEFYAPASIDSLRNDLASNIKIGSLQQTGPNQFILRTESLDQASHDQLFNQLKLKYSEIESQRLETVGPILGRELIKKTLIGILFSTGFILVYVAYRFRDKKYGICAVLAMLHDSLIMLGVFSFLGFYFNVEIDALFVTALLTILSFSVHDTIVVYDRIRESQRLFPKLTYTQLVNKAVTETLTRSINNSLTIIFMLLALYLLGGITTKWFVFALLIGTISGTYSSTFTAAPLLVLWEDLKSDKNKKLLISSEANN